MKAGFIGLGTMGAHMAANLQKGIQKDGHTVIVHDVRKEAAAPHIKNGAIWADTPAAVAAECDVIFTSLPGPVEFDAVSFGANGLLSAIRKDAAYFDLTTNSPTTVRKARRGIHEERRLSVRCSGQRRPARRGDPANWRSGAAAIRTCSRNGIPVLSTIGDQARYIGPIGAGSVAKLVHNCYGYIATAAAAEVFSMGVKAGIEPLAIWEAVRQGAIGRRGAFDSLTDQFLPNKYEPPAFALRLAHKDVSLATALGPRIERADAAGQSRAGGFVRGVEPRLGQSRLARDHGAANRTGRRRDQGRSATVDRSAGEQSEERLISAIPRAGRRSRGRRPALNCSHGN